MDQPYARSRQHGFSRVNPEIVCDADETTPLIPAAADGDVESHSSDGSPMPPKLTAQDSVSRSRRQGAVASTNSFKTRPQRLLFPFLIYCIAMGAVAVPKINIILALICVQYEQPEVAAQQKFGNDQVCHSPSAHMRMGRFMMCAHMISGIGCAISSPRMGKLSDRYGRKPLLAFSSLGLLCGDAVSIIAAWFPHRIPVYVILLEFVIGGLTGSFAATMAIIQSYAADCTEGEGRVSIFSRLHACMYIGQALGPAAGGLLVRLVGQGDLLVVFYAAILCHASFILFVLFGVRESLPKVERPVVKSGTSPCHVAPEAASSKIRACIRVCNILRPLSILRPEANESTRNARKNLPLLACTGAVVFGIQVGLASVLILYAESRRLGWDTMEASLFVSLTNTTRAIVLTAVMPLISQLARGKFLGFRTSRAQGGREASVTVMAFSVRTIQVTILLELLSQLGLAMADNSTLFILSGVLTAAGAPASPTIQSLMTVYVDAEHIGELLGAVSLLHALARALLPAIIQLVYSVTAGRAPETVFWVLIVPGGAEPAMDVETVTTTRAIADDQIMVIPRAE